MNKLGIQKKSEKKSHFSFEEKVKMFAIFVYFFTFFDSNFS